MQRTAVVTGGVGAIGGAICAALSASGHVVVPLDQHGPDPVDLADADHVRAAAARILADVGRCDVFVHAAAAFDRADLAAVDLTTWRRVHAVNVESALLLAQAFAPAMAANGFGRIIFVVSDTIWSPPSSDLLAYVTSKAALVGLARTLAMALGKDGIAVTCVAPGLTATSTARTRSASRRIRGGLTAPGAPPKPGTGRRCPHRRVPRVRRRRGPDRPDPERRRRPRNALTGALLVCPDADGVGQLAALLRDRCRAGRRGWRNGRVEGQAGAGRRCLRP